MMQQLIEKANVPIDFVREDWGDYTFDGGILDGKYKSLPCDKTEHTELVYGDETDDKGHKINVLKFFYVKENDVFVLKSMKAIQRVY